MTRLVRLRRSQPNLLTTNRLSLPIPSARLRLNPRTTNPQTINRLKAAGQLLSCDLDLERKRQQHFPEFG